MNHVLHRWSSGPAVVLAVALAAGCQSAPLPTFVLQPPALVIEDSLLPGGALGPIPEADAATGEEAAPGATTVAVRCRLLYLRSARTNGLEALAADSALVADLAGAQPVLRTPSLTASTLSARGAAANAWIDALDGAAATEVLTVADKEAIVPPNATFHLAAKTLELVEDPRDWLDEFRDRGPIPRAIGVDVTAKAGEAHVALTVTDLDPERETALREAVLEEPDLPAGPPPPAQDEIIRREILAVVPRPAIDEPLLLYLEPPFSGGNGVAMAIIVERLPSGMADGEGETAAISALATAAERLSADRMPLTEAERQRLQNEEALEAFRVSGGRPALLQVAQESGARLAQNLAVVADASFLAELRTKAFPPPGEEESSSGSGKTPKGVSVRWRLESAAWNLLAAGALEETLDPELSGLFYRQAGALAAFPDIIQDIVRSVGSSEERFEARLDTEQRYFLEDASPAARLRAFDWLVERGADLGSYDPLGERAERRAALEELSQAAEAPARDAANDPGQGAAR
ncbi:MAG: hypothetical protein AAGG01_02860 [Planctomycetota bacterium]